MIAIFNHIGFERIFDVTNEFVNSAKHVLKNARLKEHIKNYAQFETDILGNMSYVRRISKLSGGGQFAFTDKIDKTRAVVEKFSLSIVIDDENKFVYENKYQLGDYVNLMQDAFYKTLIGGVDGIDIGRTSKSQTLIANDSL